MDKKGVVGDLYIFHCAKVLAYRFKLWRVSSKDRSYSDVKH